MTERRRAERLVEIQEACMDTPPHERDPADVAIAELLDEIEALTKASPNIGADGGRGDDD